MQNYPTFHKGKFPVAYDCAAPACEVISLREWLFKAEAIMKGLKEFQRVMEARVADGITHHREADAAVCVRDAANMLRTAMLLAAEDADVGGVKVSLDRFRDVTPACSGQNFFDYEVYAVEELGYLAGLYGRDLHTHYLAQNPSVMPHRHWMVMQAIGASFTHLLHAIAHMTVADADMRKGKR